MTQSLNYVPDLSWRRSGAPTGSSWLNVISSRWLWTTEAASSEKQTDSSHCPALLPSLSSNISALSYHCIFPLIYSLPGSFPSSPPRGGLRATAAKYLGRSPHFPDGFSKTSTTVHPGCSWGGTPWQILSQSSGRIVPECRPQSGRSGCPGPPEHNKPRTTVSIQITTKLQFFSEHTKQQ